MMEWSSIYSLAVFSSIIAAMLLALAYAIGKLLQNPRFILWVKTEIFQIAVSILLVFIALFLVGLVGLDPDSEFTITASWITTFSEDAYAYPSHSPYTDSAFREVEPEDTIFEVDEKYLQNLAYFSHRSVRASRAMMGAMEEYSKYTRTPCVPVWLMCLMGVNGINVQPLSGAVAFVQSTNLLLYTTTASYLTVLAQIGMLRFIQSGLLFVYLPLAIVLRSLPFMRPMGGGLLAICFSLFIIFPLLLFLESAFWDPFAEVSGESPWSDSDDTWGDVGDFVSDVEGSSEEVGYGDLCMRYGEWFLVSGPESSTYTTDSTLRIYNLLMRMVSISFLSSTFLFALNIITVSASAALFARLLGTELDMSRLVQII